MAGEASSWMWFLILLLLLIAVAALIVGIIALTRTNKTTIENAKLGTLELKADDPELESKMMHTSAVQAVDMSTGFEVLEPEGATPLTPNAFIQYEEGGLRRSDGKVENYIFLDASEILVATNVVAASDACVLQFRIPFSLMPGFNIPTSGVADEGVCVNTLDLNTAQLESTTLALVSGSFGDAVRFTLTYRFPVNIGAATTLRSNFLIRVSWLT